MSDLSNWQSCDVPTQKIFDGKFVKLERLHANKHGDGLFAACTQEDANLRFAWLPEYPPATREDFQPWLEQAQSNQETLFYVVIDKRTNQICGRQTFMRIDAKNGAIEIGNIFWNKDISQSPVTTEALYLFAKHAFDDLGYRRFEWKCNNDNEPSKKAALRFGFQFEGLFRQHMIVKNKNRDTAWFAILDKDWPALNNAYMAWLDDTNFDEKRPAAIYVKAHARKTWGCLISMQVGRKIL